MILLPSYLESIDNGDKLPGFTHKEHELSFSWRNTIPWSLECEMDGYSRELGIKQFGITLNQSNTAYDHLSNISIMALGLINFWMIASCCCGNCALC